MTKFDPERETHKAWLGLLQPLGLVVAPPALIKAQAVLDKNAVDVQQALLSVVERPASTLSERDPELRDFPRFATEVLGWAAEDLAGAPGGPALPESLEVALPEYGETLRPSFAAIDGMADGTGTRKLVVTTQGLHCTDSYVNGRPAHSFDVNDREHEYPGVLTLAAPTIAPVEIRPCGHLSSSRGGVGHRPSSSRRAGGRSSVLRCWIRASAQNSAQAATGSSAPAWMSSGTYASLSPNRTFQRRRP